ncbi:hypothetical protein G4B88_031544 [Cannabis sativa]|uniref:Uncharacterized protein n=1 Tax=Cannabis sativa TaxID=3483 RepID=A0A7J6G4U3_CANSA|nr:hypothetical protein G4B88_031544 [Cannabis sativa]
MVSAEQDFWQYPLMTTFHRKVLGEKTQLKTLAEWKLGFFGAKKIKISPWREPFQHFQILFRAIQRNVTIRLFISISPKSRVIVSSLPSRDEGNRSYFAESSKPRPKSMPKQSNFGNGVVELE